MTQTRHTYKRWKEKTAKRWRENEAESLRNPSFGLESENLVEHDGSIEGRREGETPVPELYQPTLEGIAEALDGVTETDPLTSDELPKKAALGSDIIPQNPVNGTKPVVDFDFGAQLEIGTSPYRYPLHTIREKNKVRNVASEQLPEGLRFSEWAAAMSLREDDGSLGPAPEEVDFDKEKVNPAEFPHTRVHYYSNYHRDFGDGVRLNAQGVATQLNATLKPRYPSQSPDETVYEFLVGRGNNPGMLAVEEGTKHSVTAFSPRIEEGEVVESALRNGMWKDTYSTSPVLDAEEAEDRHGYPRKLVDRLEALNHPEEKTFDALVDHIAGYTALLLETPGESVEVASEAVDVHGEKSLDELYGEDSNELVMGADLDSPATMREVVERAYAGEPIPASFYHEPSGETYTAEIDPSVLSEDKREEYLREQFNTHYSTVHHSIRGSPEIAVWEFRTDANAGVHEDKVAMLQAVQSQAFPEIQSVMGEYGVSNQDPYIEDGHRPWLELSETVEEKAKNLMPDSSDCPLPEMTRRFVEESSEGTPAEREYRRRGR
jgi:hypothetical protein